MDHDEALEALEIAALEPGGLDRLMAGDTTVAAAVAGHVAGCPSCAMELERLSAQVPLLRDVIRTTPPEDLRARTLDLVRARGVARGVGAASAADDVAARPKPSAPVLLPAPAPVEAARPTRSILPWIAAIAVAVAISVVASAAIVGARLDAELAARDSQIAQLSAVTTATLSITAEPDVEHVALVSPDGAATAGSLLFSPSTTELVVVATDLAPAPPGSEYRCWVVQDGERAVVGKLFFGGGLAYWIGDVAAVAGLTGDATFGVSLVEIGGSPLDADPVITGDL